METSTTPTFIPSAAPPKRGWWGRNWKWVAPIGCLAVPALFAAFIGAIAMFVFGVMKSDASYKTAVSRAEADPRVTSALGTPIEEGWFVSGQVNSSGGQGQSKLSIPIHGPKGDAKILTAATRSTGEWVYSKLVVQVDKTGETIDILQPG